MVHSTLIHPLDLAGYYKFELLIYVVNISPSLLRFKIDNVLFDINYVDLI